MPRLLGGAFAVLCAYYAWFFSVRHEPATILQIVALGCAAALLLLGGDSRLKTRRGALLLGVGAVLALSVLVVVDTDSHSVSDTLNRGVPSAALVLAVALTVGARQTERSISR
jgi:peptidoglycan/LPS O-acetylase OafA/YrhL